MWILRRGSHSSLPRISLHLAVAGQVSPVPLPKMWSTITRTIATEWSGSKFVPAQAMPIGHVFTDGPKRPRWPSLLYQFGLCAFIPKEEMEQEGYGYLAKALR